MEASAMTTPRKRTAPCLTHTRRLKRESNASESLILRRPEFTREVTRARFRPTAAPARPVREAFPRASLRRFRGWPEGLLALFEVDWRPQRLPGAA